MVVSSKKCPLVLLPMLFGSREECGRNHKRIKPLQYSKYMKSKYTWNAKGTLQNSFI